jgi:hypothetical protein
MGSEMWKTFFAAARLNFVDKIRFLFAMCSILDSRLLRGACNSRSRPHLPDLPGKLSTLGIVLHLADAGRV